MRFRFGMTGMPKWGKTSEMKAFSIAIGCATLLSVPVAAQQAPATSPFGARSAPRPPDSTFGWDRDHRRHGDFPSFIIVEREVPVIVEREVLVERVAPPPPPAPAPEAAKRKPYAIGASYASLPSRGCMKLIEDGTSYYFCGGAEWYRQIGEGSSASYRAVKRQL